MKHHNRRRYLWILLGSLVASAGLLAASAGIPQANDSNGVLYFNHQKVDAAFSAGATLYPRGAGNFSVLTAHRDRAGEGELHTRDTDVIYMVEGSAAFVTGGKLVNPRHTAPDEIRGAAIEGGTSREIVKGDLLVIPPGIPHWFKEVPGEVRYLVVKVR